MSGFAQASPNATGQTFVRVGHDQMGRTLRECVPPSQSRYDNHMRAQDTHIYQTSYHGMTGDGMRVSTRQEPILRYESTLKGYGGAVKLPRVSPVDFNKVSLNYESNIDLFEKKRCLPREGPLAPFGMERGMPIDTEGLRPLGTSPLLDRRRREELKERERGSFDDGSPSSHLPTAQDAPPKTLLASRSSPVLRRAGEAFADSHTNGPEAILKQKRFLQEAIARHPAGIGSTVPIHILKEKRSNLWTL